MIRTALLLGFLFLNSAMCTDPSVVYICNSGNAKKYHLSPDCRGLSNCQHRVVKESLEKAKKEGKTLCKWEK